MLLFPAILNTSLSLDELSSRHHSPATIFYNRVPKCGSETLIELARILGRVNSFTFIHSRVFYSYYITESQQVCTHTVWFRHLVNVNVVVIMRFYPSPNSCDTYRNEQYHINIYLQVVNNTCTLCSKIMRLFQDMWHILSFPRFPSFIGLIFVLHFATR